jgi:hypothetical protein
MEPVLALRIQLIADLLAADNAYTLSVPDVGIYVIAKYTNNTKSHICRRSDKHVKNLVQNEKDYILWFPKEDGTDSIWGKGVPLPNVSFIDASADSKYVDQLKPGLH